MASEQQPRRPKRPTGGTRIPLKNPQLEAAVDRVVKAARRPTKAKPGMADPGAKAIEAERLKPKNLVKARPQPEPIDTPKDGVTYAGKCKRCDQPIRVHIKATEGTFQLLNFYSVRCMCKGQVSLSVVGPSDHEQFAALDPSHPANRRLEAAPE